jgi:hypothetical protein
MRPNARTLAMRDPAAAIMAGAIDGADFGCDVGSEYHPDASAQQRYVSRSEPWSPGADECDFGADFGPFGADFGADFGYSEFSPVGADAATSDYGADFGDDDFGAAANPTPQQLMAMHRKVVASNRHTARRAGLLEPNKGSRIKVERYSFGLSQDIVIGVPVAISMNGNPSVDMRPQRVTSNAPGPNFVFLSLIQVANVVVTVGQGFEDANDYAAHAVGTMLDLPTLSPQNRATIAGTYDGFIPPAYVENAASRFCMSFKGWAEIVA